MSKTFTIGSMMIGSFIGGHIPLLWGGEAFSMAAILWSGIGGLLGISLQATDSPTGCRVISPHHNARK